MHYYIWRRRKDKNRKDKDRKDKDKNRKLIRLEKNRLIKIKIGWKSERSKKQEDNEVEEMRTWNFKTWKDLKNIFENENLL